MKEFLNSCLKSCKNIYEDNLPKGTFINVDLKKELLASIVTFLVALPLCLGVAIASGVPAVYGLITGIIGGMICGFFSGCPLQITGPAGGLIVIVLEIINQFGIEKMGFIVLAAGLIQVLIGYAGIAPWLQIVSPAIIRGMLGGIGVIIFASQFHVMLNSEPGASTIGNLVKIPELLFNTLIPSQDSTYHIAAGVGLLTFLVILFWETLPFASLKSAPPTLVAVIFISLVTNLLNLPIEYVSIPENIFEEVSFFNFNISLSDFANINFLIAIIALSFIASVEAILTTKAIDTMNPDSQTDHNKEIIAQGLGNSLVGMLGSLPLTGVIVRSVVAHESGGRTKLVAILQGFFLLLTLFLFAKLVAFIPLACLATILVLVSFNLMKIEDFKKIYDTSKSEFVICMITLILVVTTNIFAGVLIGVLLSGFKALKDLSKFSSKLIKHDSENIEIIINGSMNFINLPSLNTFFKQLPSEKKIVLNAIDLSYIDHSCFEAISNWEKQYIDAGGEVIIRWDKLKSVFA